LFLLRDRIGTPMRHLAPPVVSNPDQAATILLFAIALPVALAYILARAASAVSGRVAQGDRPGSAALAPGLPAGPT
jgi:hypothetical protein